MKLIRSGGVNATLKKNDDNYYDYGFGNYFMRQIKTQLDEIISQGEKVAICVAAKPDKRAYDQHIVDLGFDMDNFIVLGRKDDAAWEQYTAVLLLGGGTKELYLWLGKTGFNLTKLKKCRMLAGDSAGAYVLSGKTLLDYASDGSSFKIVDGFLPELNQLIVAHINNPYYHEPGLAAALSAWSEAHNVECVGLQENEVDIAEI